VVASARALAPSAPRPYHPLHCGQWSLLSPLTPLPSLLARSQSPSLRGSGRFRGARRKEKCSLNLFQSPSLRGSGRFACLAQAPDDADVSQSPSLRGSGRFSKLKKVEFDAEALVSIPFIAGQWSLPGRDRR